MHYTEKHYHKPLMPGVWDITVEADSITNKQIEAVSSVTWITGKL